MLYVCTYAWRYTKALRVLCANAHASIFAFRHLHAAAAVAGQLRRVSMVSCAVGGPRAVGRCVFIKCAAFFKSGLIKTRLFMVARALRERRS